MDNFISVVSYFIEFLIAYNFFNDVFLSKIKNSYSTLIGITCYLIILLVFIFQNNALINVTLFFTANTLFAFICFKCNIKKAILSSIFLAGIMSSTEFLSMSILSMAYNGDINTYNSNFATYTIGVIFSKTLFFVFTRLSISLGFHLSERTKTRTPFFLFLFPVSSLVILYTFWVVSSNYALSEEVEFIISGASIAIILAIILTYVFYGKTSKELDELYKAQSEAERINTDIAYYSILDRQNDILKTFVHDEKNHLTVIKSLADNPEVNKYIDKIYGQIKHHSMFGNTKNKMLDLMINKYQYICENESIDFSVSIKTANLSFIEQSDLIALISNILDNSVEAAKNSREKIIDLSINKVNGFDILTCSNSCDIKPQAIGKTLKSTKTDDGFHGLGVKSIKRIVNKYHGDFEWSYDENTKEFVIYIAFKQSG